jgi:ElaB/YqjD/DUF883 family membrane-anchored ribosome-binding protein
MADPKIQIVRPRGIVASAESRLLGLAEEGKAQLVKSFDGVVLAAHEFAASIDTVAGAQVAEYVRAAAGLVETVQNSLRDKPVQELLEDGRALIRERPVVAVGVAMAAGFLAARLFKAAATSPDA